MDHEPVLIDLTKHTYLGPALMLFSLITAIGGSIFFIFTSEHLLYSLLVLLFLCSLFYAMGMVLRVRTNELRRRRVRREAARELNGEQEADPFELTDDGGKREIASYTLRVPLDNGNRMAIRELVYTQNQYEAGSDRIARKREFDALRFEIDIDHNFLFRLQPVLRESDDGRTSNELPFSRRFRSQENHQFNAENEEGDTNRDIPMHSETLRERVEELFEKGPGESVEGGLPFLQVHPGEVQFIVPYDLDLYKPERIRFIGQKLRGIGAYLRERKEQA